MFKISTIKFHLHRYLMHSGSSSAFAGLRPLICQRHVSGFFLISLLILFPFSTISQSLTDGIIQNVPTNPIPADHRVLQEAVWKGYRLELIMSPSQPYLRGPTDFLIQAKKEIMKNPFPGSIAIGFENLSNPQSSLQETQISREDFEEDGLAKITHIFTESGNYTVTVSFTDLAGELFVLNGSVEIKAENLFTENKKYLIYFTAGILGIALLLFAIKKMRK